MPQEICVFHITFFVYALFASTSVFQHLLPNSFNRFPVIFQRQQVTRRVLAWRLMASIQECFWISVKKFAKQLWFSWQNKWSIFCFIPKNVTSDRPIALLPTPVVEVVESASRSICLPMKNRKANCCSTLTISKMAVRKRTTWPWKRSMTSIVEVRKSISVRRKKRVHGSPGGVSCNTPIFASPCQWT